MAMGAIKIGYERLSQAEKRVYEQFEKAFSSCAPAIDGNGFDCKVNVMKVFQIALGDNPHIIYFDKTQIRTYASLLGGKRFRLIGACSRSQNEARTHELRRASEQAVEAIEVLNPLSDYDKLMCIYEYLQDHVTYDQQELESLKKHEKSKNPQSHNAYGALVKGIAVCDGIAAAFCLIAQSFGYSCMVVSGRATFSANGFSEHTWNLIQVGPKYYHLDATWDIVRRQQTGEYSYEYFCVDDGAISADHDWEISMTPPCSGNELSFYSYNRCVANNLTQLDEIFARYARSKQNVVRTKISDGIAIPEPVDQYLGRRLIKAAAAAGRCIRITYIWNRGSRCFYAKFNS